MIGDTVIYGFFHRLVQFHSRIMIFSDSAYECCVLPQYQTFLQQHSTFSRIDVIYFTLQLQIRLLLPVDERI